MTKCVITVNVLVHVRQTCDPRGNSEPPKKLTSGLVFHSEPWRICSFSVQLINNSLIYSKVLKICSSIQVTCDSHIVNYLPTVPFIIDDSLHAMNCSYSFTQEWFMFSLMNQWFIVNYMLHVQNIFFIAVELTSDFQYNIQDLFISWINQIDWWTVATLLRLFINLTK